MKQSQRNRWYNPGPLLPKFPNPLFSRTACFKDTYNPLPRWTAQEQCKHPRQIEAATDSRQPGQKCRSALFPWQSRKGDVNIPTIHSNLPWTKGRTLPLPYFATWNPKNVINDMPASDRLLKPSAEIATEWLKNPTAIFVVHKNRFGTIPTILDLIKKHKPFLRQLQKYLLHFSNIHWSAMTSYAFPPFLNKNSILFNKKGTSLKTDSRQIHLW